MSTYILIIIIIITFLPLKYFGPRFEESPVGGTVSEAVIHGTTDENAVYQFGDLYGHQREGVTVVVDCHVVVKE